MMRYTRPITLIAAMSCFMVLSGCADRAAEEASTTETTAVPVATAAVTTGAIRQELVYTAAIEAWETRGIVPDIGGKIQKIYVDTGDRVKKDQLLAKLDTESQELMREQAVANLHAAEAARADAERNYKRMEELVRDKTVSDQQHEKAKLAFDTASAQVEQAKAAADIIEYNIRKASMKAPFDGIVSKKNMNEGDMINPSMGGGSSVVTVKRMATVKAIIRVPDTDLRYMSPGLPVAVTVDACPGETFAGVIHIVPPATSDNSRLFGVEIKIDNPGMKLKDGMFARASIVAAEHADALTIPVYAVLDIGSAPHVFVLDGSTARKKDVTTGIVNNGMVEILTGLSAGDTVIVKGQEMINDGTAVTAQRGDVR